MAKWKDWHHSFFFKILYLLVHLGQKYNSFCKVWLFSSIGLEHVYLNWRASPLQHHLFSSSPLLGLPGSPCNQPLSSAILFTSVWSSRGWTRIWDAFKCNTPSTWSHLIQRTSRKWTPHFPWNLKSSAPLANQRNAEHNLMLLAAVSQTLHECIIQCVRGPDSVSWCKVMLHWLVLAPYSLAANYLLRTVPPVSACHYTACNRVMLMLACLEWCAVLNFLWAASASWARQR